MSKSRAREENKVHTPEQQWRRLTGRQRAALLVMGESEPIGVPYHVIQGLIDWYLVIERKSGWILTPYGIATRDYGRSIQP